MLENSLLLQELGTGYVRGTHWNKEGKPLHFAIHLQHTLLTKLNIMPSEKEKMFKGPVLICAEEATQNKSGTENQYIGN